MRPALISAPFSLNIELEEDYQVYFDEEQEKRFYRPLASWLIDHSVNSPTIIGIAGPPGSGKTTFSYLLAFFINKTLGTEKAAAPISMDGWHFDNNYLDTHTFYKDGVQIPLRKIKGAPVTFDLKSFVRFVKAVRKGKRPTYPIYNRSVHDVIQSLGKIPTQTRLFLLEGNYLLLDMPGWTEIAAFCHVRIFIDTADEILRSALRKRHLRGGKEIEVVDDFIEQVDLKNAALVRERRLPAHILITKVDEATISDISYLTIF